MLNRNDGIIRNRCILRFTELPSIELNSTECNLALHILHSGDDSPARLQKLWDLLFDSIAHNKGVNLAPEDILSFSGPAFSQVNPEEYANNG